MVFPARSRPGYVESCHDGDRRYRYAEDFAETMALFVNEPEKLVAISPTCFKAMQQIFQEVMLLYPEVMEGQQLERIACYDEIIRRRRDP